MRTLSRPNRAAASDLSSALVLSLDFELHWGYRDKKTVNGSYEANFRGARMAIPKMLDLFRRFGMSATWAIVGFLFAETKQELIKYSPRVKPSYAKPDLYPYDEEIGMSEKEDPFHYAGSLIKLIRECPGQEIGSHTFSHYYCLEPGQDRKAFSADMASAVSIAASKGIKLTSLVFPRNQVNSSYGDILIEHGILCYRGTQQSWMYRNKTKCRRLKKVFRLIDAYFNIAGAHTTCWQEMASPEGGLCNLPGNFFLRPYTPGLGALEPVRLKRITESMTYAARNKEVIHLFWHPHNFGVNTHKNLHFLERILGHYQWLHERFGMESMTMSEVAQRSRASLPDVVESREPYLPSDASVRFS